MKIKFNALSTLSLIVISTVVLTAGCKKNNGPAGASAQLSATIGTKSFQPFLVVALDNAGHVGIAGEQVVNGDTLSMTVFIPDTAKTGQSVAFSQTGDAAVTYSDSKGAIAYSNFDPGAHGTIIVTSFDKTNKKVAGTFSGVIYSSTNSQDSLKVSGQFNTSYISL